MSSDQPIIYTLYTVIIIIITVRCMPLAHTMQVIINKGYGVHWECISMYKNIIASLLHECFNLQFMTHAVYTCSLLQLTQVAIYNLQAAIREFLKEHTTPSSGVFLSIVIVIMGATLLSRVVLVGSWLSTPGPVRGMAVVFLVLPGHDPRLGRLVHLGSPVRHLCRTQYSYEYI